MSGVPKSRIAYEVRGPLNAEEESELRTSTGCGHTMREALIWDTLDDERRKARPSAEAMERRLVAHVVALACQAERYALEAKRFNLFGPNPLESGARRDAYYNALREADALLTWFLESRKRRPCSFCAFDASHTASPKRSGPLHPLLVCRNHSMPGDSLL